MAQAGLQAQRLRWLVAHDQIEAWVMRQPADGRGDRYDRFHRWAARRHRELALLGWADLYRDLSHEVPIEIAYGVAA